MDQLPDHGDLIAARERLRDLVHKTPLLSSRYLARGSLGEVHLKCENLQRSGSFKIRGALNACLLAQERGEIGDAGVLTYSSGNHGQAVALAARLLEFPATIVVPVSIPAVKRAAIEEYGATVVTCGTTSAERFREALKLSEQTGALIIPPFDNPHVIAGQATVALEIFEEQPEVETILVPVGGGGLIAGVALAAALRPEYVRVVGVEPETANAMALSLAKGERVSLAGPPRTIADGLCPVQPGRLTFAAAQKYVEKVLLVTEPGLRRAQEVLLERAKLLVEPSGAATVAALLEHAAEFKGQKVVLVLSGGNTVPPEFAK